MTNSTIASLELTALFFIAKLADRSNKIMMTLAGKPKQSTCSAAIDAECRTELQNDERIATQRTSIRITEAGI